MSEGILPCHFSPNANSPDCSRNYLVKLIAGDRPVNSNSFHSMGSKGKVNMRDRARKETASEMDSPQSNSGLLGLFVSTHSQLELMQYSWGRKERLVEMGAVRH